MNRAGRLAALLMIVLGCIASLPGCSRSERREVEYRETRHESDPEPVAPGRMVVE